VDRARAPYSVYPQISSAPLEILELQIDTDFDEGPVRVLLALADVGGAPRLLAWNVIPIQP